MPGGAFATLLLAAATAAAAAGELMLPCLAVLVPGGALATLLSAAATAAAAGEFFWVHVLRFGHEIRWCFAVSEPFRNSRPSYNIV